MLGQRQPIRRDGEPALYVRLVELEHAAAAHQTLDDAMLGATRALGFESFLYAVCTSETGRQQPVTTRLWTSGDPTWQALYEARRYIDVDPRFTHTCNRAAPYVWDGATSADEWQVQAFVRDAARFGICSGVAVSFRDAHHARIVLALDSQASPVAPRREAMIQRRLGDVMLLATALHDLFEVHPEVAAAGARSSRASLSMREKECLRLAARGMTSADIGSKLGITARTANFHFSNLIGKLGVVNRHEAIARAVSTGLI